jgi:nucleoside-diphosphate-sugar epimerase
MVYGAWPDNPVPLTEEAPLRPNAGLAFAVEQAELERLVADWKSDHPGVAVVVLRAAPALPPRGGTWLERVWRGSVPVRVRGAAPPVQFVHLDDLAAAVLLACAGTVEGTFNVAPDGWIAGDDARALAGGSARPAFPERVARRVAALFWRAHLTEVPPGVLPWLVHPWVIANDRLRALGWTPEHTNEEAYVAGHEVSRWRAALTRRRQQVVLGAAGAGVAGAAAAITTFVRGRRRAGRSNP